MAERKIKQWITINGVHVPIYEGESKEDAVKRSISKAKENARANEDQKAIDIKKNIAEKSVLSNLNNKTKEFHKLDRESIERGDNVEIKPIHEKDKLNKANSLIDEQNKIIEKYGPDSKEYRDFKKKKDEFTGKKVQAKADGNKELINGKDASKMTMEERAYERQLEVNANPRVRASAKATPEELKQLREAAEASRAKKGSLSDASAGKASDEARVKKETASDYDKEFGTVGKVDINNVPSAQLMKRLNDLSLGDEPVGKFWDKSAELYSVYKQLYSVANQKDSGFKFTKQNEAAMYQYRRYYNDGDVPGWARGPFNEYSKSTYNRSWGYHTTLSGQGEMELERRANKAVVSEYKRYQKFINTVPKSFAANYPNLSNTELKKKYQEFLKKNKK